jgi:hypothetical protein
MKQTLVKVQLGTTWAEQAKLSQRMLLRVRLARVKRTRETTRFRIFLKTAIIKIRKTLVTGTYMAQSATAGLPCDVKPQRCFFSTESGEEHRAAG